MALVPPLVGMTALLLAGCASIEPLPDHPGAIAAIEDYYRQHAWEEGARCVLPEMEVTRARLIESSDERTVVEVRYFWWDERAATDRQGNTCTGFDTRTFRLAGGRVVEMSGEQRP